MLTFVFKLFGSNFSTAGLWDSIPLPYIQAPLLTPALVVPAFLAGLEWFKLSKRML
jgi:hypothetical protein